MSSTSCCHSESPLFVSVVWAVWLHLRAPPAYYSFLLILLLILNFPLFPLLCCITLQQKRGGQRGFSTSPLTSVPIHRCARPLWTVSLYAREEWLSKIVSRVGRPEQNKKKSKNAKNTNWYLKEFIILSEKLPRLCSMKTSSPICDKPCPSTREY